jgi:predicted component of type VI protein secretion system
MGEQTEKQAQAVTTTEAQGDGLLDQILSVGMKSRTDVQAQRNKDIISTFVNEVMQGQLVMSKDMETAINSRISTKSCTTRTSSSSNRRGAGCTTSSSRARRARASRSRS